MKIALCDDEHAALAILQKQVWREFQKRQIPVCCVCFQSGIDLRRAVFSGESFDIIFMDIDMPDSDGIDVAVHIQTDMTDTFLIFVLNMEQYVYRSLRARPFRFIRKSHLAEELPETIDAVLSAREHRQEPVILLETGRRTLRLNPLKIIYVECNRKELTIYMEQEAVCIIYKLSDMEALLAGYGFIRIHKGFLANYRYIFRIDKQDLVLDNGKKLPVSRNRMNDVKNQFRRLTL